LKNAALILHAMLLLFVVLQVLAPEFDKPSVAQLQGFLQQEWGAGTVYPPKESIFRAFNSVPFDQVGPALHVALLFVHHVFSFCLLFLWALHACVPFNQVRFNNTCCCCVCNIASHVTNSWCLPGATEACRQAG
jgi:hypothetical protein